ncbi:hypothetical protein BDF21DRAFT_420718 [Thamnidium elegans]|nr:hypothetical protein BDF21DRAFT_420718 [Thamnidium elegans]
MPPPEMKRQNAFSADQEPFREIACRICYQSEACGEWKRIICQCSIKHDYYHAHEFCFNKTKRCKVCHTPYIERKPQPKLNITMKDKIQACCQFSQEKAVKHKRAITVSIILVLCLLFLSDFYNCITITKVDKSDLPALADDEYMWLPVKYIYNLI